MDWYHAADHLAQAATALYPDDPKRAQHWLRLRQDDLFLGQIQAITTPLDNADLTEHSHYFHNHQRRMQYHEFRENGLPIGSGTVESGVKQFKTRLTAAGMRWNRPGAVLDNSFNALSAAAA